MGFDQTLVFIFSLTTALVFTVVGRLMTSHANERPIHMTPFFCFMTGAGLWYFWCLLLTATLGVSLDVAAILFGVCAVALALVMSRAYRMHYEIEHFWTMLVLSLLFLFPFYQAALGHSPAFFQEFEVYLKNAFYMYALNGLPAQAEAAAASVTPPAAPLFSMPAHLMGRVFSPTAFGCMNIFLLAVVAGSMARSAGFSVKWSNLPLVGGGALLGVTLLNPFLQVNAVFASFPDIFLGAVFLAAMLPLISDKTLPQGWGVLPSGFILALLVGTSPAGPALAGFVVLLWLLRVFWERPPVSMPLVFGLIVLVCLPALADLQWSNYLLATGLPALEAQGFFAPLTPLGAAAGILVVGFILFFAGRVFLAGHTWKRGGEVFVRQAHLLLPTLYLLYALIWLFGIKNTLSPGGILVYGQFLLLLPFWIKFREFYEKTALRELLFRAPWVAGFLVLGIFLLYQEFAAQNFISKPAASLTHTLNVAESVKNSLSGRHGRRSIAVLDLPGSAHAADVLAYGLGLRARVLRLNRDEALSRDADTLLLALNKARATHLWVHGADEPVRKVLGDGLQPGHSYLLKLRETYFEVEGVFPHPSYQ